MDPWAVLTRLKAIQTNSKSPNEVVTAVLQFHWDLMVCPNQIRISLRRLWCHVGWLQTSQYQWMGSSLELCCHSVCGSPCMVSNLPESYWNHAQWDAQQLDEEQMIKHVVKLQAGNAAALWWHLAGRCQYQWPTSCDVTCKGMSNMEIQCWRMQERGNSSQ